MNPSYITRVHSPLNVRGFTLIEILITLSVLSVAILTVMSSMSSLQNGRRMAEDRVRAGMVAQSVMERLVSMDMDDMCKTGPMSWSQPRFVDSAIVSNPPLTPPDLVSYNLMDLKSVPNGCRVYIEYYRGTGRPQRDATTREPIIDPTSGYPLIQPAFPGLLDGGAAGAVSVKDWQSRLRATPLLYCIVPVISASSPSITSFIEDPADSNSGDRDALVIRVVVFWPVGPIDTSLELICARTRT